MMPSGVRRLMPRAVGWRTRAGPAGVLGLLTLFALPLTLAATAALPAGAAHSLARQRQPLQLAQIHARQPHCGLQVLAALLRGGRVAGARRLLRQQPIRLSRGLDLRLP